MLGMCKKKEEEEEEKEKEEEEEVNIGKTNKQWSLSYAEWAKQHFQKETINFPPRAVPSLPT